MHRAVKITRGASGWGGPLVVKADEKRNKILCVTGNEVSPIAAKLAQMTGCELVDGFSTGCPDDEVLVAVVDCGGFVMQRDEKYNGASWKIPSDAETQKTASGGIAASKKSIRTYKIRFFFRMSL